MALILEDGTGMANADSLVSLAEVRAFAASRGQTVSAVDATLEGQIRSAHDYLLAIEDQLQGWRRTEGQALFFPREGVVLYGYLLATGTIPAAIKNVLAQLVIDGASLDLLPATDGKVVISEAVGPISTTYAVSGTSGAMPVLPRVDALLKPLLRNAGRLTSLRV